MLLEFFTMSIAIFMKNNKMCSFLSRVAVLQPKEGCSTGETRCPWGWWERCWGGVRLLRSQGVGSSWIASLPACSH